MIHSRLSIVLVLSLFFSLKTWGYPDADIASTSSHDRLNYETLSLPHNEKMGFLGGTILYDIRDGFSIGPAFYGAASGQRGGFITLGLASGFSKTIVNRFSFDSGLFVGAGGGNGGFTLVGGGLMLRTHLGLYIDLKQWGKVGLGESYVYFPNGSIRSWQPYLSYQYSFESLFAKGWINPPISTLSGNEIGTSVNEVSLIYKNERIPAGVTMTNGMPQFKSLSLLGANWDYFLNDRLFLTLESEGASGGGNEGYMQILMGAGYRLPSIFSNIIKLSAAAGVGGGSVDTGGGALMDVAISVQRYITNTIFVALRGGYDYAPSGAFKATNIALQLGYGFESPSVATHFIDCSELTGFEFKHLRLRTTNQTYFHADKAWRVHHADQNINLLGLQGDYFFRDNFYLTGQGISAYQGDAGAYMAGLIGVGGYKPFFQSPVFVTIEGLLGAAGGGGVNVGSGLVGQINAGLGYQLTDSFSLMGSYGYIRSANANFKAHVLGATLAYQFTGFTKKVTHGQRVSS